MSEEIESLKRRIDALESEVATLRAEKRTKTEGKRDERVDINYEKAVVDVVPILPCPYPPPPLHGTPLEHIIQEIRHTRRIGAVVLGDNDIKDILDEQCGHGQNFGEKPLYRTKYGGYIRITEIAKDDWKKWNNIRVADDRAFQTMVLTVIRDHSPSTGVLKVGDSVRLPDEVKLGCTVDRIVTETGATEEAVRKAVDDLLMDLHIYATVDMNHYKAVDAK